uniref:Uncharacterized protein n=1 Tax=Echeneis naucrates TaxID=173247 RepID=A0A665VNB5_ECHNA
MPSTKVIKSRPAEATRRPVTGAGPELKVPAVRKSRPSSCSRGPQRGTTGSTGPRRRARSASAAPRPAGSGRPPAAKSQEPSAGPGPGPGQHRSVRAENQSHRAFTVIPPNPKKRREMQRKAEAELAALEELRLSRAMAYVSINPSSVGGCMSLEEVRMKQQQEMMEAKRKRKLVMEKTPVLMS